MAIKLLGLTLVLAFALPGLLSAALALLLATLLAIRFFYWKPQLAFWRLDIGVMYIGYLCLVAQLVIEALGHIISFVWVGSVSVHLFSFGVMGLIIPGMIVRISKGHTGRKVVFEGGDKLILCIMLLALVARILAPQWLPAAYLGWIHLSAACWFAAFGLLAWRTIPLLLQPRIDGHEH
jgi:uncharacterized protein involved in response to NO